MSQENELEIQLHHVALLRSGPEGVQAWNRGRSGAPAIRNLNGARLHGARLNAVDLSRVNLTAADLSGSDLRHANLREARLTNANLAKANLANSNLRDAGLIGANLTNTDFTDAELGGANLSGANLTNANLSRATLVRARLDNVSLRDATLTTADLSDARLNSADLRRSDLGGATLSRAELNHADLTAADLRGATLIGAQLDSAHLNQNTAFSGSVNLLQAKWEKLTIDGATFNRADIESGKVRLPFGMGWFGAHHGPNEYIPYPASLVNDLDRLTVERAKRKKRSSEIADQIREKVAELSKFSPPREGDTVLGSELLEIVGSGNFGDVYRARPVSGEPDIAIKVFHASKFGLQLALHSFRRGVEAMEKLRDAPGRPPSVIEILHVDEARLAFSMRLAAKIDLSEAIDGNWTLPTKLRFFQQLATAVQFAHQNQVLHRDIKPENILVTEALEPILTDFDIADLLYKKTLSSESHGTVLYAAPEQLEGTADRNYASDICSLGRILHFLLMVRHPPFAVDRIPVLEDLAGQPEGLVRIVRKCTLRDPLQRYQRVDELLADLKKSDTAPHSVGVAHSLIPERHSVSPTKITTSRDRNLAFAFGAAVTVVLLYAALRSDPIDDPRKFFILRTTTAVAAAGVAALIPGLLQLRLSAGKMLAVRSGGAIATLVLILLVNPPDLLVSKEHSVTEPKTATAAVSPVLSATVPPTESMAEEWASQVRARELSPTQRSAAAVWLISIGKKDLSHAWLSESILSRVDLADANLAGANLSHAQLKETDLRNANLKASDLSGADLHGARLDMANLEGARLTGATYSRSTTFPQNFDPVTHGMTCTDCNTAREARRAAWLARGIANHAKDLAPLRLVDKRLSLQRDEIQVGGFRCRISFDDRGDPSRLMSCEGTGTARMNEPQDFRVQCAVSANRKAVNCQTDKFQYSIDTKSQSGLFRLTLAL